MGVAQGNVSIASGADYQTHRLTSPSPLARQLSGEIGVAEVTKRVLRTDAYRDFILSGKGESIECVVSEAVFEVHMDYVYMKQSRCKCRICDRARKKRDEDEKLELDALDDFDDDDMGLFSDGY